MALNNFKQIQKADLLGRPGKNVSPFSASYRSDKLRLDKLLEYLNEIIERYPFGPGDRAGGDRQLRTVPDHVHQRM